MYSFFRSIIVLSCQRDEYILELAQGPRNSGCVCADKHVSRDGCNFATVLYGKKSLTKRDLKPLEENTAHMEDVKASIANLDARARRQEEDDHYTNEAKWVSVTISGSADFDAPLLLSIELAKDDVQCKRIELRNDTGNASGEFKCEAGGGPLRFAATIPPEIVNRWRNSGPSVTTTTTQLVIRVWMRFLLAQAKQVRRDVPVKILTSKRPLFHSNWSSAVSILTIEESA